MNFAPTASSRLDRLQNSYNLIKEQQVFELPNYRREPELLEGGTAVGYGLTQSWAARSDFPAIPLWRLSTDQKRFHTPTPIAVRIYREGQFFFAENDNLTVYGTGENLEDAIKDFGMHILYFFEYYRDISNDKLMGDALRLKSLYHNLLVEE